ncbi:DNA-3-methyladenine glycosylase I [Thaumasiovibrio sp. DFM-14]|uniref:DNA-3-methyladenine glycosylase I n=1 Tax=Thaumasiovibrio sp. DFM-14 TaxID=3384792 RepID=UPI0039A11130
MRQLNRCGWLDCNKPDYVIYHDEEWGVPEYDDQRLFELLTLESAQAGLSWYTILKKRENYRQAFHFFEVDKVAAMTEDDVLRLLQDAGIVRHRAKIEAAINNARRFIAIQTEFGSFAQYMWAFVDGKPINNCYPSLDKVPTTTPLAERMAKDLKKRGFKFLGPTTVYSFMQANGMVNDHTTDCFRHVEVSADKA